MEFTKEQKIYLLGQYELANKDPKTTAQLYKDKFEINISPEETITQWGIAGFLGASRQKYGGSPRTGIKKSSLYASHVRHDGDFPKMFAQFGGNESRLVNALNTHNLPAKNIPPEFARPRRRNFPKIDSSTRYYVRGNNPTRNGLKNSS